ncbi:hypothetical protein SUGI_0484420 [Cryptomeria japonica]|nr:hypothetical protein SUGI_0484420 [Cryptomeria japonica]
MLIVARDGRGPEMTFTSWTQRICDAKCHSAEQKPTSITPAKVQAYKEVIAEVLKDYLCFVFVIEIPGVFGYGKLLLAKHFQLTLLSMLIVARDGRGPQMTFTSWTQRICDAKCHSAEQKPTSITPAKVQAYKEVIAEVLKDYLCFVFVIEIP